MSSILVRYINEEGNSSIRNRFREDMDESKMPFKEIKSVTDNLADENLISQGSSGKVYRGHSDSENIFDIVVRELDYSLDKMIILLCMSYHKNMSSPLCWSKNNDKLFLAYKFEANGSLAEHLSATGLTWAQRLSICIGVGQVLKYIHFNEPFYFIHGNIKSSKILLDDEWQPKLEGFESAMVAETNTLYVTSKYEGTLQYKDPTYEKTGALTAKSDVFSFGVVLFEVLFGRKASTPPDDLQADDNWNFAEFARLNWENKTLDDVIDLGMRKHMDSKSIEIFSNVAYACLMEQRETRPDMDNVVRALEDSLRLHEHSMVTETSSSYLQGESFEELMILLKDILSATENFNPKYQIGSGGFATVYKAKLKNKNLSTIEGGDDGSTTDVAIKVISSAASGGEKGFIAEVQMLSKCKHPNIVSLLGFCDKGPQILIYEYVPNGSLDEYLKHSYRMTTLTWGRRIQICLDIAHGLEYLHSGLNGTEIIIHRDIKSANILLDDNLRAKIADFGLSRLSTISSQNSTIKTNNIAGTNFYLDPAYEKTGFLKKASDIYSFGVVLFEILCGTLAYDKVHTTDTEKGLPFIARRLFKEGESKSIVDRSIKETDGSIFSQSRVADQHSLDTFLNIAHQCLAETQDDRPKIKKVIEELEKALIFQKNNQDNLQFLLEDINLATKSFSDSNCIGEGKFWKVYKGEVPQAISKAKGCTAIVVKRWNKSAQGHQQFFRELEFVFKNKHENITNLVGYCTEMEEKIIVYEHSSKGSLDKHLKDVSLTWMERLKICIGVARGLKFFYKSSGNGTLIMHADIKSHNILIDEDRKTQISNLELSTTDTFDQNTLNLDQPIIIVSKKSDTYSLGVVLFEVLSGSLASEDPSQPSGPLSMDREFREQELDEMVFEGIKDQIDPFSLIAFTDTLNMCFWDDKPKVGRLVQRLEHALEYQNDIEESPKVSFSDIKLASDKCIQEGRYWKLYEAQIRDANGWIPVYAKCWDNNSREAHHLFFFELRNLLRSNNKHVVAFVGYCNEMNEKIIFHEHASNGSLDKHLDDPTLTWKKRLNICIDVAKGLQYLHGSDVLDITKRKHVALKSGSILIDDYWKAKIANLEYFSSHFADSFDYGYDSPGYVEYGEDHQSTMYVEYVGLHKWTSYVDLYALGVVLLETLCGRLAWPKGCDDHSRSLGPSAKRQYNEKGNLDELVFRGIKEQIHPESLIIYQRIAIKCLETGESRPTATEVVNQLEKALELQKCIEESPRLSLENIKQGTQNFRDDKCVGKGRYWKLYAEEFPDANTDGYKTALVKRWDSESREARHGFFTELRILYRYRNHNNIIGVQGYINEMDEKILVYEHRYIRSLDNHLDNASLSWTNRLKIGIEVASVLEFFQDFRPEMIHGDIKSGSILIDGDWNAKLSNFDLSSSSDEPLPDNAHSSLGYVDPHFHKADVFVEIYSFGVVLLELLCGRLAWPEGCAGHFQSLGPLAKRHYKEKGNLYELVFEGIKEEIAPESLNAFQRIALKCFDEEMFETPTPGRIVKQLKHALELQEDYEMWNSKLPKEYKEIIQMSKTPEVYSTVVKKDLYNMLTKGILLQQDKLWFTLGANGESNEMISAMTFSYKNRSSRKWQSIPESRFQKVAQMWDISSLKIQIRIKTQFLSPGINYGVYLVFKFCQSRKSRAVREYVNLTYKMGKDNLHAYFATWRDDEWMMIELCRFSNDKKDVDFEAILKSFSRCYCGSSIIYVEGLEFRSIDNASLNITPVNYEEVEKATDIQQVVKTCSNIDEGQQSTIDCHEIFKTSVNGKDDEKMFSVNEVNQKKYVRLSPTEFLFDSCNVKPFDLNPSSLSRSQGVEFLRKQVFRIKCKIESQMLSPDTDYVCYLVFKVSEKCNGLHGPVIIRDLLNRKNKETKILYFKIPSPWNLHNNDWVPRERKDGWIEVAVWKFNSKSNLRNDGVPMNLKLVTYDGTMFGLMVCNLEIRPI